MSEIKLLELIDDLLRETIQKSVQNFENSLFFNEAVFD